MKNITATNKTSKPFAEGDTGHASLHSTFAGLLPDPVILYDTEGEITYLNPAFTDLFGWTLSDLKQSGPQGFIPKENLKSYMDQINEIHSKKQIRNLETSRLTKNGRTLKVCVSTAIVPDDIQAVVSRIETYREIRQNDRDKFEGVLELAGAVCHELSQPAMIIQGYADLFLLNLDKNDPLYAKMEKLRKQVNRISDLTQKLMKVTKYETVEYSNGKTIVDIHRSSDAG